MGKKAFLVDVDRCTSCKLCVVACKDEHVGSSYPPWTRPQPETGHFWVDIVALERGRIPRVRMSYLPLFCQHCADAPCAVACVAGAIKTRDDGLVWIDAAICTGCGKCRDACPYDVIYMNPALGIAQKCTGCAHRVDEGALPRCVDVCPHEAIAFGEAQAALFSGTGQADALEVYHPEYRTEPRVLWKGLPKPWIAGVVIDAAADEVLEGVEITASDSAGTAPVTVLSDAFGDFWLRGLVERHDYRIELRKAGYKEVRQVVTTDRDQDLGTVALERLSGASSSAGGG